MITLITKNQNERLQCSSYESIEKLKERYYSMNSNKKLPNDNDEVVSLILRGENTGMKFLDLMYLLNIKHAEFIPVEKISELVDLYYSNHKDLVDLEARYNNNELEENISPSESFEQGYENALLQVFKSIGIQLGGKE